MRIGNLQPTRPDWYDRNPVSRGLSFNGAGVAPAGQVTRWTYTCPAAKKAMIESTIASMVRDAVTATPGVTITFVNLTLTDASFADFNRASLFDGTLGAKELDSKAPQSLISEGEVMIGATFDGSTGGTFRYSIMMKVTEFDA